MNHRRWFGLLLAGFALLPEGPALAQNRAQDPPGGLETNDDRRLNDAEELFRQSVMLGVPEDELRDLVRACRNTGFTGEEISRLLTLVAKAKLASLPHEDLLNKLREGIAKEASPESIQRALEQKAKVLQKSKRFVDMLLMEGHPPLDYDYAVRLIADAFEAGATPDDVLRSVREDRPCAKGIPDVRTAFGRISSRE